MEAVFSTSLFILLFIFTEQITARKDVCPPWFVQDNKSTTGCSCGNAYANGAIVCGSDSPLLHFGFCMTYNSANETTEYGPCPFIARYNSNTASFSDVWYLQLPSNASLLNEFMCGPLNREVHCVRSVKMAMVLHCTRTLWSAVSAGDMVMDGSCTISWNCFQ